MEKHADARPSLDELARDPARVALLPPDQRASRLTDVVALLFDLGAASSAGADRLLTVAVIRHQLRAGLRRWPINLHARSRRFKKVESELKRAIARLLAEDLDLSPADLTYRARMAVNASKGGRACAKALTPTRRRAIAKHAAAARFARRPADG